MSFYGRMMQVYMDLLAKNARKFKISVKSAQQMTTMSPHWWVQRQKIVDNGLEVSYIVQKDDYWHSNIEIRQVYMDSLDKNARKFEISVKSAPQMTTLSPEWVGSKAKNCW